MNQIVKVTPSTIGNSKVNAVDARELHGFLEVGRDFSTWIKSRIAEYGFVKDADYGVFTDMGEKSGGRPRVKYIISIDTAKELSMVEKTDKGKQARKYFIECEKRLKADPVKELPENIQCQLMGAETISRMLGYSEASKIDIVKRVYDVNGVSSAFLPEYAEKQRVVFSATVLLKRNKCDCSAKTFNALMLLKGYLVQNVRPSTKGRTKQFKALTDKGMYYGQNDVSPMNKLETQPHYFEDTFMELYEKLLH